MATEVESLATLRPLLTDSQMRKKNDCGDSEDSGEDVRSELDGDTQSSSTSVLVESAENVGIGLI